MKIIDTLFSWLIDEDQVAVLGNNFTNDKHYFLNSSLFKLEKDSIKRAKEKQRSQEVMECEIPCMLPREH